MPWEALAGAIGTFEGPIRKPVEVNAAGEQCWSVSPDRSNCS
jgi:hypothetical protein